MPAWHNMSSGMFLGISRAYCEHSLNSKEFCHGAKSKRAALIGYDCLIPKKD